MIDWSVHAGHELTLDEVRGLAEVGGVKNWGWVSRGMGGAPGDMMIAGNDDAIAMRFLRGYGYESVTRALWRELCRDAKLVADIGSHSGVFTLDAYHAGAQVVFTAEPNPVNYARVVMNVRRNGFSPGGIYYGAMGDTDGVGSLLVKEAFFCHAAGRMGLKNERGMELPVRVSRMDTMIPREAWESLRVVKIDAENYTPNVLRGMGEILSCKPDLIVECTEAGMDEILRPFGYRFWKIWETGRIEECADLTPWNPMGNYNGTDEDCRNRFCSVRGLPE